MPEYITKSIEAEMTGRGVREALWLAILQTQRAGWMDLADPLLRLHQIADERLRGIDGRDPNEPERVAA